MNELKETYRKIKRGQLAVKANMGKKKQRGKICKFLNLMYPSDSGTDMIRSAFYFYSAPNKSHWILCDEDFFFCYKDMDFISIKDLKINESLIKEVVQEIKGKESSSPNEYDMGELSDCAEINSGINPEFIKNYPGGVIIGNPSIGLEGIKNLGEKIISDNANNYESLLRLRNMRKQMEFKRLKEKRNKIAKEFSEKLTELMNEFDLEEVAIYADNNRVHNNGNVVVQIQCVV